jgi:L-lactate dehydrogenase complex protein LldG
VNAARDDMLARIRAAVAGAAPVVVPRTYRETGSLGADEVVARFVERVEDYGATVIRSSGPEAEAAALLRGRVVVAADLPAALRPAGVALVEDDNFSAAELDGIDAALTTCAAACAETGSIALDGGAGQGRRAITLIPDLHVCIVRVADIVETVPELIDRLAPSAREGRPIVIVSGPSATSDIELDRVEGVHGPRRLVVVLHDEAALAAT